MTAKTRSYKAIVIGSSTGGMKAFQKLFAGLPETFSIPIIAVLHQHPTGSEVKVLVNYLNTECPLSIVVAEDKSIIRASHIYMAPPDYHLLVERDATLALSIDEKVNFARPSIDLLFESAAYTWSTDLIGILLTGANSDGVHGMELIKKYGGHTLVQDPATAESPVMPRSAIETGTVDKTLTINAISSYLNSLNSNSDLRH